jgi:hypothetical protein
LQWLQDPSEINEDNLNNVRCEASRNLKNNKREYRKDKIMSFATNRTRTLETLENLRRVTNLVVT